MDLRWEILAGYGPLFVGGLWMTIQLTLVAIGAGLVLGMLLRARQQLGRRAGAARRRSLRAAAGAGARHDAWPT